MSTSPQRCGSPASPRRIRSKQVVLHAGEPCYLVSAQTGITGERATTRLIRLDASQAPVQESESSVDSDEPTEFSANTKQLLTLYEELHSFKDDPTFPRGGIRKVLSLSRLADTS